MEVCRQSLSRLTPEEVNQFHEGVKKKRVGLNVGQARRIVYDRNEWQGFVRGNA